MRLTIRVAVGILGGILLSSAFAVPASALPKFLPKFHKSAKKAKTEAEDSDRAPKAENKKHTDGFPEGDKKGAIYQPQFAPWYGDQEWKTSSNKAAWEKASTTQTADSQ
jgi:hypothetical protein